MCCEVRLVKGAYACVYEAEAKESLKPDDVPAVFAIKVESKKLASWELSPQALYQRLSRGVRRETSLFLSHLRVLLDAKSQTFTTGALVMKFGDHGTLQDVVNFYKLTERKTGAMDENSPCTTPSSSSVYSNGRMKATCYTAT